MASPPSRRLRWPSHARRRPSYPELAIGGGLGALGVILPLVREPDHARWTGGILMDGWVRHRLDLSDRRRHRAALTSDGLLYSSLAIPVLEVSIGAFADRLDPDLVLRLTLAGLVAFGMAGSLTAITKVVSARERPFSARCPSEPDAPGCGSSGRFVSFFSGHTSMSFTAAGFSCLMHQSLHLYGRRGLDAAACGLAMAAATATGTLRVVADQHWTSDVLVGAGVGLLSGWLVPYLLYFRKEARRRSGRQERPASARSGLRSGVFVPWATARGGQLSYLAAF